MQEVSMSTENTSRSPVSVTLTGFSYPDCYLQDAKSDSSKHDSSNILDPPRFGESGAERSALQNKHTPTSQDFKEDIYVSRSSKNSESCEALKNKEDSFVDQFQEVLKACDTSTAHTGIVQDANKETGQSCTIIWDQKSEQRFKQNGTSLINSRPETVPCERRRDLSGGDLNHGNHSETGHKVMKVITGTPVHDFGKDNEMQKYQQHVTELRAEKGLVKHDASSDGKTPGKPYCITAAANSNVSTFTHGMHMYTKDGQKCKEPHKTDIISQEIEQKKGVELDNIRSLKCPEIDRNRSAREDHNQSLEPTSKPWPTDTCHLHSVDNTDAVYDFIGDDYQTALLPISDWQSSLGNDNLSRGRKHRRKHSHGKDVCNEDETVPIEIGELETRGKRFKRHYPWRGCRTRRAIHFAVIIAIYLIIFLGSVLYRSYKINGSWAERSWDEDPVHLQRHHIEIGQEGLNYDPLFSHRRWRRINTETRHTRSTGGEFQMTQEMVDYAKKHSCSYFNVTHFKSVPLTPKEIKEWGWPILLLVALYMFCAIASVCDIYFVPSLEHICEGTFVSQNDIGAAAIVGSSIFNMLFIVGACAIFAGMNIQLSWYPLTRDSVFYTISVVEMVTFMMDELIKWYEALIMCVTYLVYVMVMAFNTRMEAKANRMLENCQRKRPEELRRSSSHRLRMVEARTRSRISTVVRITDPNFDPGIQMKSAHRALSKLGMTNEMARDVLMDNFHQEYERRNSRRKSATNTGNIKSNDTLTAVAKFVGQLQSTSYTPEDVKLSQPLSESNVDGERVARVTDHVEIVNDDGLDSELKVEVVDIDDYESPFLWPESYLGRFYYIIIFPITVIHAFTIPDTRIAGGWQAKCYILSFTICIGYIVIYSYVMVWMVEYLGVVYEIPTTVTGLTILAAGTSVPDCLASIFVARDGYGDMAISNAIGSNVFDILLCLGVPWLLQAILMGDSAGSGSEIESAGMVYVAFTLLFTVAYLVISLKIAKWTMTFSFGVITLLVYVVIIGICLLIETNTFGQINKPKC